MHENRNANPKLEAEKAEKWSSAKCAGLNTKTSA